MILAVTGGTGFIGSEVIRQAVSRGDNVRLVSRRDVASATNVATYRGDIISGTGLAEAFRGADVVVHAAGLAHRHAGADTGDFAAINGYACGQVVRRAGECGVRRVVVLSSVSVYGGTLAPHVADETTPPKPNNPYGLSKLAGEVAATFEATRTGVALRILRLGTVIGAGDPGNILRLIRAVHRRRFVHFGSTDTRKSMIHRTDAARACLAAADDPGLVQHCYNVVTGTYTVGEVASVISTILGVPLRPVRIPVPAASLAIQVLRTLPGPSSRFAFALQQWCSDEAYTAMALERAYSFQPSVSLRDGLAEEIAWYLRGLVRAA